MSPRSDKKHKLDKSTFESAVHSQSISSADDVSKAWESISEQCILNGFKAGGIALDEIGSEDEKVTWAEYKPSI